MIKDLLPSLIINQYRTDERFIKYAQEHFNIMEETVNDTATIINQFNVNNETNYSFFLDLLGYYVGVSRYFYNNLENQYMGYVNFGLLRSTFLQFRNIPNSTPNTGYPFFNFGNPIGSNTTLSNENLQQLIRYACLCKKQPTTPNLVLIMKSLTPSLDFNTAFVENGKTVTITIKTSAPSDMSNLLFQAIQAFGIIPRPAGVQYNYVMV